MPLHSYGVLKGKAIEVRLGTGTKPHYQVRLVDDTTDYRIAINVKSQMSPSEVEYIVIDRFVHPITAIVEQKPLGFTALAPNIGSGALDFIRGNLFDRTLMRPLPYMVPGPDNDLNEKVDAIMQRAIGDENAMVYAFGERWGPEANKKDKYFGFLPGNGIHDIHMNQGNSGNYVGDDGIWQDGGLIVHFPDQNQWTAIFLKFQSQTWHTDDVSGHAIGTPVPAPLPQPGVAPEPAPLPHEEEPQGLVRIVGALVNSSASPEEEVVTLLNTAPHTINLAGWALLDTNEHPVALTGSLAGGSTTTVKVVRPNALSNQGGIITLVNETGLKVDGVSYTKAQARNPGWTLVF